MDDWERIDKIEKEIEYIKQVMFASLKRQEKVLEFYMELLSLVEHEIIHHQDESQEDESP